MTVYFDFETTASTDTYYDSEQKEKFVVSYVIIVAFHPKLIGLNRVICERSLGHSYQKLNTIDYFTDGQMGHVDVKVVKQLKDAASGLLPENVKKHQVKCFRLNAI